MGSEYSCSREATARKPVDSWRLFTNYLTVLYFILLQNLLLRKPNANTETAYYSTRDVISVECNVDLDRTASDSSYKYNRDRAKLISTARECLASWLYIALFLGRRGHVTISEGDEGVLNTEMNRILCCSKRPNLPNEATSQSQRKIGMSTLYNSHVSLPSPCPSEF